MTWGQPGFMVCALFWILQYILYTEGRVHRWALYKGSLREAFSLAKHFLKQGEGLGSIFEIISSLLFYSVMFGKIKTVSQMSLFGSTFRGGLAPGCLALPFPAGLSPASHQQREIMREMTRPTQSPPGSSPRHSTLHLQLTHFPGA